MVMMVCRPLANASGNERKKLSLPLMVLWYANQGVRNVMAPKRVVQNVDQIGMPEGV